MPHSPPIFVCSSPGPDPYRSHDNVYEELDQPPTPTLHRNLDLRPDDDFGADEIRLTAGEQSVSKPFAGTSDTQSSISTIYHERPFYHYAAIGQDQNTALLTRTLSTNNYHHHQDQSQSSLLRKTNHRHHQTLGTRTKACRSAGRLAAGSQQQSHAPTGPPPSYEPRCTRPVAYDYSNSSLARTTKPLHIIKSNNCDSSSSRANAISSFAAALQHEVEVKRRNQFNNHLTHQHNALPPVSTIYRSLAEPTHKERSPHCAKRSRTNPRAERKRSSVAIVDGHTYGTYRQPLVHQGIHYELYQTPTIPEAPTLYPHVQPELCTTFRQTNSHDQSTLPAQLHQLNPISSRDSSFGSDSGYSHHTHSSNHIVDFTTTPFDPATAGYNISHINRMMTDIIAADRTCDGSTTNHIDTNSAT